MTCVRPAVFIIASLFVGITCAQAAQQSPVKRSDAYPLWNFDEIGLTCRAKGRLQDPDYCASHLMDRVIADGKKAIPILISQLTETRPTKEPIYDYWAVTTSGDIAYFILNDLFTDSDWTTFNMPGLKSLNEKCDSYAEDCWDRFLKKHGRKFVQDQWLATWKKNNDRVYWEESARCFRLSPQTKTK